MPVWLSAIGGIILVDLVLSGDNALVIGAVAAELPREQRWKAILIGGAGAIVLRIGFAILATLLLQLPLLQAIGGVVLLFIAIRLLMSRNEKQAEQNEKAEPAQKSFFMAIVTILVADAMMSLDNVLSVGALADGNILLLALGLVFSIALLLFGSALISSLMRRLTWLLDIASLVLAWTAANMILSDLQLGSVLNTVPHADLIIPVLALGIVAVVDIVLRVRARRFVHAKV